VNTVYGDGATTVGPIMESGLVSVLAFIGSTRVANILKRQHPKPNRLKCVLGLGAKNPAIVLPDADLDLAVPECVAGALSFNGQRCTALKIFFVHASIAEEFTERFAAAVAKLKLGMPWDDGVDLTPLPEDGKPERLRELVDDAVSGGARLVNEGGGAFVGTAFTPAVVYGVTEKMRLWREEQFGPVVPIATYDDAAEAVAYIRGSAYGQQVSIFGRDPQPIADLVDPLVNLVCRVNINSKCQRGPDSFPFTGRKDSAEGTLSVSDALRVFAIRTLVAARHDPANSELITRIVRERRSKFLSTDFLL
jgi:glyceraldehyde-3-phosphate dehydrogenase (NADP+)